MLIQELRLQRGWSQEELAEVSGLSVRTVQRIERGQPGSLETLKALAAVFEIDFNRLKEPALDADQSPDIRADEVLAQAHVRRGSPKGRITLALQGLSLAVGLALALAVAAMAWRAHEARGMRIEAFSVPPELAQRGVTGQVVASQLLDRLRVLQAKTVIKRPASSSADGWRMDINVETPETGVSIGALNRSLRGWLGSETHISGEIVRTPLGLAVTARVGPAPGWRFEGPDASLDMLMAQAAEAIYAQTQPYHWAVYLSSTGRQDEALATYKELARSGSPEDRHRASVALSERPAVRGDPRSHRPAI
jgi:DNA-binding XRE family transcriptional regulator